MTAPNASTDMQSLTTVAIVSIGEMGMGIAQLLIAHNYQVMTFAEDRSERTKQNARAAGVKLMPTLESLANDAEVVLSIVPPGDAFGTAERLAKAVSVRQAPLYYIDLNATSPTTAKRIAALFESHVNIVLIDGGIIGGVPRPLSDSQGWSTQINGTTVALSDSGAERPTWHCPSLLVSGPTKLPDPQLSKILNIDHINSEIGAATGVKMCFAATTKGFISLVIQSYTTAHQLGVLENLRGYLAKFNPNTHKIAENGLVSMPPKAYRWVGEMLEIGDTFETEGNFESTL